MEKTTEETEGSHEGISGEALVMLTFSLSAKLHLPKYEKVIFLEETEGSRVSPNTEGKKPSSIILAF